MYLAGSTEPASRVISLPSGRSNTIVGYPPTLKRLPSACPLGVSPSTYTGTNERDLSMKSWRVKMVLFTWLHGGHQAADQNRNTGWLADFARSKALSTSLIAAGRTHAISFFAGEDEAAGPGLSGAFEHAIRTSGTSSAATGRDLMQLPLL
jgi:hypothetical protein